MIRNPRRGLLPPTPLSHASFSDGCQISVEASISAQCCLQVIRKSTPVVLIQYKIYLNIKHCQGFPIFRTTYKSHFSMNYLCLKSQLNTHIHRNSYKHNIEDCFFPRRQKKKQGGKLADTVTTGNCYVAPLI